MKKFILWFLVLLLCMFSLGFVTLSTYFGDQFTEEKWRKLYKSTSAHDLYKPHFKNGKFFNPWLPREDKIVKFVVKWLFTPKEKYSHLDLKSNPLKLVPNSFTKLKKLISEKKNFIYWIGHASFLIKINNTFILTDPMFSDHFLHTFRRFPPPVSIKQISSLTNHLYILLTHNHYDHLDEPTLKSLPPKTTLLVPLGLKKYIETFLDDDKKVIEMDWWQGIQIGKKKYIIALPSQHWSRRFNMAHNYSLWLNFMIISDELNIFYSGDSGYFVGYKEFGRIYPNIDYAILPIAPISPRWYMHYDHMIPQESLEAFKDLKAKYYIPAHWGLFDQGDEPIEAPAVLLRNIIKKRKLDKSRFLFLNIGESHQIKNK